MPCKAFLAFAQALFSLQVTAIRALAHWSAHSPHECFHPAHRLAAVFGLQAVVLLLGLERCWRSLRSLPLNVIRLEVVVVVGEVLHAVQVIPKVVMIHIGKLITFANRQVPLIVPRNDAVRLFNYSLDEVFFMHDVMVRDFFMNIVMEWLNVVIVLHCHVVIMVIEVVIIMVNVFVVKRKWLKVEFMLMGFLNHVVPVFVLVVVVLSDRRVRVIDPRVVPHVGGCVVVLWLVGVMFVHVVDGRFVVDPIVVIVAVALIEVMVVFVDLTSMVELVVVVVSEPSVDLVVVLLIVVLISQMLIVIVGVTVLV